MNPIEFFQGIAGVAISILLIVFLAYWIVLPILIWKQLDKLGKLIEQSNKHLENIRNAAWDHFGGH